jgi:hypothetical protein
VGVHRNAIPSRIAQKQKTVKHGKMLNANTFALNAAMLAMLKNSFLQQSSQTQMEKQRSKIPF